MFNIPMNTKPAMGLGSLANNLGGQQNNSVGQQTGYDSGQQSGYVQQNNQQYNNVGQQNMSVNPNLGGQVTQQSNYQAPQTNNGGGVILKKGQKASLSDMSAGLDMIDVCLGWECDANVYDLDSSCFMVDAQDKVIGDGWFVFYGQLQSPDGSIVHAGDCKDGSLQGDDEVIHVTLSRVDPRVQKLVFVVTINEAKQRGLNFSGVRNAYIRIVDKRNGAELTRFNLTDYYDTVTSMMVGEVYRYNNSWKLNAIGNGVDSDLEGLCIRYGVNVAG